MRLCLLLLAAWAQPSVEPQVTPRSNELVFTSDRSGIHQLYRLELGSETPRRLFQSEREERHPRWSPDGKSIAYESLGQGTRDIFILELGGQPRRLTENASAATPAWSPDGKQLVFMTDREGAPALWTMNVDGTKARRLSPPGAIDRWPDWSPDGTRIAFSSLVAGDEELFIMNTDGSERRRLTVRAGEDSRPRFTTDGKALIYCEASERTGASDRVMRISLRGGTATSIEDRDELRKAYIDRSVATWGGCASPDGSLVFASIRGGNADLYLLERVGGQARALTDDSAMDQDPDWRPVSD